MALRRANVSTWQEALHREMRGGAVMRVRNTELELMSPFATLEIGQTLDFPIAWELHRLPASCGAAASRRAAALAILNTAGR